MRVFYYNLDLAAFVDANGDQLSRVVPDLYYQENPDWRFMLRRGNNSRADLDNVVAWGAAVDCDFGTESTPMCRTLSDGIHTDYATGAVTVSLDCSTASFFEAVNGKNSRQAWFELYGLDANGKRILYLCVEIQARMTIDPDPEVSPETPDTVATKAYVSAVMSSGAAAAGALMSGAEIETTVGGYTVALTSGGGLTVSGSGASVVLSGGELAASGANGEFLRFGDSGGTPAVSVGNGSASLEIGGANPEDISLLAPGGEVTVDGAVVATKNWVGSQNFARQLVTSTDDYAESATIAVLSGGTSYVYTSALYSLEVASVAKSIEASYIHFALDSVTAPTPVVISGVSYLNSAAFEGGTEYLVGLFDGMAVVNEVTSGGTV
jgi:hypothetical protein